MERCFSILFRFSIICNVLSVFMCFFLEGPYTNLVEVAGKSPTISAPMSNYMIRFIYSLPFNFAMKIICFKNYMECFIEFKQCTYCVVSFKILT